jgi:hypothetical protein
MPKIKEILKIALVLVIFILACTLRLSLFPKESRDIEAYTDAFISLMGGVNPYTETVQSFDESADDRYEHGFAYLPALLYTYVPFTLLSYLTGINYQIWWKVPVLLADIGIGVLLIQYLYKKSYPALILGLLAWFFNPYILVQNSYTYWEPLPVFFLLLSLKYLGGDDKTSGISYAISIAFKTFAYILFPIYLLNSKNVKKFLLSALAVAVVISLPFMRSADDFMTYVNGSVLVHSERFVQGRPLLYYFSYLVNFELIQIIPVSVYAALATITAWASTLFSYFKKGVRDNYILATLSFAFFYLFTPVLNRTYFLWFFPVLLVGVFNLSQKRGKYLYYLIVCSFYAFYYWYLAQWETGFDTAVPF